MNFNKYHVSRNLFDESTLLNGYYGNTSPYQYFPNDSYRCFSMSLSAGTYTILAKSDSLTISLLRVSSASLGTNTVNLDNQSYTFTLSASETIYVSLRNSTTTDDFTGLTIMLNVGETPEPYEPYSSEVWHDIPHYIHNTSTDTITTLPAVLYPNDTTATVGLKGNMEQSGTPTPANPIQPSECGERTENLFDGNWAQGIINPTTGEVNPSNTVIYTVGYIPIKPNTIYSMSRDKYTNYITVRFYDTNKDYIGSGTVETIEIISGGNVANPMRANQNFCCFRIIASTAAYMRLNDLTNDLSVKYMIVEGQYTASTMPSYEPYGYKIPISSAGQTTPVYLGEVETTRKIKKWVLDGTETWSKGNYPPTGGYQFFTAMPADIATNSDWITTHFKNGIVLNGSVLNGSAFAIYLSLYPEASILPENATINDFKAWLAAQYAAGTPVTVWYVLAEPTTGIVNEPLRKIGDYADTVSGITIPTTDGANTISVDTTVQPSEVTANYHGWHPIQNVHVYPDSSWMPTSWEEFRKAVRSGKAQSIYPVGTKLYENWGDETSNAWIVVDYPTGEDYLDSDLAQQGYTNRVMLMEEKLNYLRVFDAKEAWLYVETAIPAGTYRFTIPNYDASYGGNKTYIFTSTVDVPVGSQLTLTWDYQRNPSVVQAYSSSTSTSALFNVSIAEWDGTAPCTNLGTIKLAMGDADSTYGKLNHIHRARYGSNNYYQSGLRQWLNADATANNWWTPTNIFDRPYDNRNTAGRLNVLNNNMKAVLATPTINCITNNLFEYPSLDGTTFSLQTAYTVKDKLFLVTHTETNLSSTPNVDSVLAYYTNAQNADRIKYRKDNGNAYYWWLRTLNPSNAGYVRYVYASGALSHTSAVNTYGSAAACIIQ